LATNFGYGSWGDCVVSEEASTNQSATGMDAPKASRRRTA
jgi:hypothetical protein